MIPISPPALALAIGLAAGAAVAYDGPVGVTLLAPWIGRGALARDVRLDRLEVSSEIAVDTRWDPARDARGRAFPDGFVATIATTRMRLELANGGPREVRARLVIPFRASATPGTGFVAPETFAAVQDGRPLAVAAAPRELQRSGMFAVRGYPLDVLLAAGGTAAVEVTVRHALAMNPSWYRFELGAPPLPRDTAHRFRVLADARTAIGLALEPGDEALADRAVVVRICTGGGACADHSARLRGLDRAWFGARLPGGAVSVLLDPHGR
jgi:hypothetical protein